jgi:hypothetical protein
MADTKYRPNPVDYGAHVSVLNAPFGTVTANTTNRGGIASIGDKDDTSASVEGAHRGYVASIYACARVIPADADGTVLLNVFKYDASAAADVTLVSSYDLEGLVAGKSERLTLVSGLTDDQRTLDHGDSLHYTIVNNSAAIDTQAAGAAVTVLLKLLS